MSSLEAGGHCNIMANGPCFGVGQPGIRGVLFSETVLICKMGMIITHLAFPTVVPRLWKNSGEKNYTNFQRAKLEFVVHQQLFTYMDRRAWRATVHGFSNMWTMNFQMFKLALEKTEEPEVKLPISTGSPKKQESARKTSTSALLTMPKSLTEWITISCGKFWKRWAYQTTWPASWETCMQVRKQQLELDMEQQTGSK